MSNELADSLYHIVARMSRESDQILQEQLGIGLSQYKILRTLQQQPHVRQRVIAAVLAQTEASISRQIRLLTERGMLVTEKNPENLREHLADLTPRGQRVIAAAETTLSQYHVTFFAGLSARQQDRLRESLAALENV